MNNYSIIPDNWKGCNINDVSIKIHYGYTAKANENGRGSKYLRITDIQKNKVDWDTVPFCEIDDENIEKFELKENDIVFARTGGTVGKSFLIKNDVPLKAVFASYLIKIKLSSFVDKKYIYFFFQSLNYWNQIELGKTGLKTNVNAQILSKLKLNLAPFPEQRAIVSKIEQLFSDMDNGIGNFKKVQEQLKIYRQAVLKKAFEGELTKKWREKNTYTEEYLIKLDNEIIEFNEAKTGQDKPRRLPPIDFKGLSKIPFGWIWKEAHKLCQSVRDGTHDTPKYVNEGIPLVTSKNLKNGNIDLSDINYISVIDHEEICKRSEVKIDDILYGMIGTIGNPVIIEQDKEFSIKNVGLFKNNAKFINPKYLRFYLDSWFVENVMKKKELIRGTTQKFISLGGLRVLPIPLPLLEEQSQILCEIETCLSICDKMEATITESLEKAEALRQSILKKAFEGKLLNEKELEEARNAPDWEPAEKLLERIKVEKTNIKAKNKGKK